MKRFRFVVVIFAISILMVTIFIFADPRNFVVFSPTGSIKVGDRFGVHIGQDEIYADKRLTALHKVKLYSNSDGGRCLSKEYSQEYRVKAYSDSSWRHGTICIIIKSNLIREISWEYGFISVAP